MKPRLRQAVSVDNGPMRERLLASRLFSYMSMVEVSAPLAYARRLHLMESLRQLVFLIGVYRGLTSREITIFSGSEKAQISRGIKALGELGLIERATLRARIRLSPSGWKVFGDILEIAAERNELFCEGIGEADIARFIGLTRQLIDRAAMLYTQDGDVGERDSALTVSIFHPPTLAEPDGSATQESLRFKNLIMPGLHSLSTYIKRSGTQIFKRELGLSHFEWQVLSQIGEYQPMTLASLVALVLRDKSQVGRTVKQLQSMGLVVREDRGRANVSLMLTRDGGRAYGRMCEISLRRDEFLTGRFGDDDRAFYLETIERLKTNARQILTPEQGKALQPMRGGEPKLALARAAKDDRDLEALREENARLKRLLAEVMLENSRLKEHSASSAAGVEGTGS